MGNKIKNLSGWTIIGWIFRGHEMIYLAISKPKLEIVKCQPDKVKIFDVRELQQDECVTSTGYVAAMKWDILESDSTPNELHYQFAHLYIANNPKVNTKDGVAESVKADITYFANNEEPLIQKGRWADSDELEWYIGKKQDDITEVNIKCNGENKLLIIAFRDLLENAPLYLLARGSYNKKDLKNPDFMLPKQEYDVLVNIKGTNTNELIAWFKLINNKNELGIKPMDEPDYYKELADES